jgi:exosortase/archaeosortase
MKKKKGAIYFIFLRYFMSLIVAVPNLWLFYAIFTPLTVYPVYFLLSLFYKTQLSGTTIFIDGFSISLIKACIAGSAYYLLFVLNMTTPLPIKKRLGSLIFSFSAFFVINLLRILFFSLLLLSSFSLFNLTHLIFWYFLSSIIVFMIWFANIKLFEIKAIPVYSDLKFLYSKIRSRSR